MFMYTLHVKIIRNFNLKRIIQAKFIQLTKVDTKVTQLLSIQASHFHFCSTVLLFVCHFLLSARPTASCILPTARPAASHLLPLLKHCQSVKVCTDHIHSEIGSENRIIFQMVCYQRHLTNRKYNTFQYKMILNLIY